MEPDYMSNDFLSEAESLERLHNKSHHRLKQKRRKLRKAPIPKKKTDAEMAVIREKGLATPIAPTNKGFKLLAMMGFKEGESLGVGERKDRGIVAPIDIQVRAKQKSGLGTESSLKREREKMREIRERILPPEKRQKLAEDFDPNTYKNSRNVIYANKKTVRDISKLVSQIIPSLDEREGVVGNPLLSDFEKLQKQNEQQPNARLRVSYSDFIAHIHPEQKVTMLITLLQYIRQKHLYCMYCGCSYDDKEDFDKHCPGLLEDDH